MRSFIIAIFACILVTSSSHGQVWDKFYTGACMVQCDWQSGNPTGPPGWIADVGTIVNPPGTDPPMTFPLIRREQLRDLGIDLAVSTVFDPMGIVPGTTVKCNSTEKLATAYENYAGTYTIDAGIMDLELGTMSGGERIVLFPSDGDFNTVVNDNTYVQRFVETGFADVIETALNADRQIGADLTANENSLLLKNPIPGYNPYEVCSGVIDRRKIEL